MRTLQDIIQHRRSIFPASYSGESIPDKDLYQILEAARWAPNHKKTEPWKYVVIKETARKRLGDFMAAQQEMATGKSAGFKAKKMKEKFLKAGAVVLIFMNRDLKERVPEWEEIAAVSMSVQNMWLTAHDLQYGCYWSSPKAYADMSQFDGLTINEQDHFLGFLYLGVVQDQPTDLPDRKSIDEFVTFIDS